jgi:hypothetical protein
MPIQRRRRLRLFWPYGHHWGALPHPMSHYGPPPGWGGWGWGRPTPEEEKEYLDDYIEMLKEELAAAEEYRKELAGSE